MSQNLADKNQALMEGLPEKIVLRQQYQSHLTTMTDSSGKMMQENKLSTEKKFTSYEKVKSSFVSNHAFVCVLNSDGSSSSSMVDSQVF